MPGAGDGAILGLQPFLEILEALRPSVFIIMIKLHVCIGFGDQGGRGPQSSGHVVINAGLSRHGFLIESVACCRGNTY